MMMKMLAVIQDGIRESIARKLFIFLLVVSTILIAVSFTCSFTTNEDGDPVFRVLFGLGSIPMNFKLPSPGMDPFELEITPTQFVAVLYTLIGTYVAGFAGIIFSVIATANFFPRVLEDGGMAILLAHPMRRWQVYLAKYLGGVTFVLLQALYLIGGTWLGMSVGTGVWIPSYLLMIPILVAFFAILYSVSVFAAVLFRNSVLCIILCLVFWFAGHLVSSNYWQARILETKQGAEAMEAMMTLGGEQSMQNFEQMKEFYAEWLPWLKVMRYVLPPTKDLDMIAQQWLTADLTEEVGGPEGKNLSDLLPDFSPTRTFLHAAAFACVFLVLGGLFFQFKDF